MAAASGDALSSGQADASSGDGSGGGDGGDARLDLLEASLQYLVLHLLHLFLWSWASGAAHAAQFVRIIAGLSLVSRAYKSKCNSIEKPEH